MAGQNHNGRNRSALMILCCHDSLVIARLDGGIGCRKGLAKLLQLCFQKKKKKGEAKL